MLNGYRTDLDYKENHLMKSRFEYKVILITGAASGLGPAGAQRVANEGAKLSLVDLNEEGLKETEKLIKSEVPDAEILLITADVRSEEHTSELQSRFDLVCRLLLEKKKTNTVTI